MSAKIKIEYIIEQLELDGRGITLVRYGGGSTSKSVFRCKNGHEWSNKAIRVIGKRKQGCLKCFNKTKSEKSRAYNIESINNKLLLDGRGIICIHYAGTTNNKNSIFKCIDGHSWYAPANNVVRMISGCPTCYSDTRGIRLRKYNIEKINHQLRKENRGIVCLSYSGTTGKHKSLFMCNNGHKWEAKANAVLKSKNGCASCCSTGFNPLKPAKLYAYRIDNFIGYGVTGVLSKEDRLRRHKNNLKKYGRAIDEVIGEWYFDSGKDAIDIENKLKKLPQSTGAFVEGFMKEGMPYNTENLKLLFKILS